MNDECTIWGAMNAWLCQMIQICLKRLAFSSMSRDLQVNQAANQKMMYMNLVALNVLYMMAMTFLFGTLTLLAQKGNFQHFGLPWPDFK